MQASAQASSVTGAAQPALLNTDSAITFSNLPTIARILEDACSKRALLTLKIETASKLYVYHSRIQLVDLAHMQIVLHKLTPSSWLDLVTQDLDVEVNCQLPSGLLRFQSVLSPLEAETINPYCVLALPGTLYKHQLRSSFRVTLPPGSSMLKLPLAERLLNGYCLNLSLEGCCGIFRGNLENFPRDSVVPALTVSLDDSLQFTTEATVCRHQIMPNGSTQLGLRFEPLDADLQRKLQASLTSLQRRQLRKNS
jgi:c-di-GMP-binding flagellar brake protein YcgR